ncbi:MAG: hypothetical protein Q4G33_11635 [bacterium]|nr:hypothetical protein [bacterium]
MNMKQTEIDNTGFLKTEYVKNVTHFFCAAVEYECKQSHTDDLQYGYDGVLSRLAHFSNAWCDKHGVKPIVRFEDNLLEYFFNQKNMIPGHVYYWLSRFYGGLWGPAVEYDNRHMQTYNELQKLYIKRHGFQKYSEKEEARIEKKMRRIVSNAFRSGKYDTAFKLYNKDLSEYIDKKEVDALSVVLPRLFSSQLFDDLDETEIAAYVFVIGRMQGQHDALVNAQL